MSIQNQIKDHLPELGEKGVEALSKELEKQAKAADEPWKKSIVQVFADATQKLGPTGISLAQVILEDLFAGKKPDISKVTDDLATASNMLAEMQKAEVKKKKLMRQFARELGGILLHALKVVVGIVL